jgi:DNA-binding MarR family transcriptional regulator
MPQSKADWRLLGFILASDYRIKIALMLSKQMATPKQIAQGTNLRIGHVSNILRNLADKELVECVNPEAKRGRIYRLTSKGKEISELMKKLDMGKLG